MENNDEPTKLKLALYTRFDIEQAHFSALYTYINNSHFIKGAWENSKDEPFELSSLANYFGMTIPEFINAIKLSTISLSYNTDNSEVSFVIDSNYGAFSISSKEIEKKRSCKIELTFKGLSFEFAKLPVVGTLVQGGDSFRMDSFNFEYLPPKNPKEQGQPEFNLNFALIIDGKEFYFGKKPKPVKSIGTGDSKPPKVSWVDINKSFKVLYFDKIGVSFDGNVITVYINAGFSILALEVDFYGLYLSIPLAPDAEFSFGLNGLAVSFRKDPIMISGGLYHILDKEHKDLYNGALMLKFSKYGFSALGSYCDNDGLPSFFLYLMLSAPMGGPPCFFVTGLALGMGVNRAVKLPDIKSVGKFPFVAAAMGNGGSKLNPRSDISEVLTELSNWIYPSNGEFFVTVGLKFTTFGVLESFALLTIEFGNRLRFSLLGLAEASIPPNIAKTGKSPIAFARLAIKVTVDPSEGYAEILASLTDESYILDKNCKLTGGFGICIWFSGARAGDFFVSLGGCHNPHFLNKDAKGNPLYPELDKVGINWKISDNIKLTADAYFALTPSCIMAGASLSLTFESGNLKAWFNAVADFLLKWKPFYYEIGVSVCVGASYKISIFGISKTFSVELGASLSLSGPEFSGEVKIKWFIISFTISFGDRGKKPQPIDWNDFSESFLPSSQQKSALAAGKSSDEKAVNSITISDGLLKIEKENNLEIYCVSADTLKIITNSAMPCTKLVLSGKDKRTVTEYGGKLGVVPMGKTNYISTITVTLTKEGQLVELDSFEYSAENGGFTPALWKDSDPDLNDVTPIQAPMGINLVAKKYEITHILPPEGSYDMKQLLEHESIPKIFQWCDEMLPEGTDYSNYKEDQIMVKIAETIKENENRDRILHLLSEEFDLPSNVIIKGIGNTPKDYLMAYPLLKTTGAQYDENGGYR